MRCGRYQRTARVAERPYEAIQQLARDFGVDPLDTVRRQQQLQTNDQAINVALQRFFPERAHTTQQQQARAHWIQQTPPSRSRSPRMPTFPAVQKMMGALMTSGQATICTPLPDMACRHPSFEAIQKAEMRQWTNRRRCPVAGRSHMKVVIQGP